MGDASPTAVEGEEREQMPRCGFPALCNAVFRRRRKGLPPRGPSAAGSGAPPSSSGLPSAKLASVSAPRRRRGGSDVPPLIVTGTGRRAPLGKPRWSHNPQMPAEQKGAQSQPKRQVAQQSTLSGELDSLLYDHQRATESSTLIRASSGNVMLFGDLGNLRFRSPSPSQTRDVLDDSPKTARKPPSTGSSNEGGGGGGGISSAMGKSRSAKHLPPLPPMRQSLSERWIPEELNDMGGMEYRKGRFDEALVLFEKAIILAPEKALYWNNKAVVLTGLGRLIEAVDGCREAVRIDPSYGRAHHRLATLYLRLGEDKRAMDHYRQAGGEASAKDLARTVALQNHLTNCGEARMRWDWQCTLKEAQTAISVGADSAPKVFALQAEALLRLQRHDEAETVLVDAPTFDIDASTKFFGATGTAYVLVVRAQVEMAAGRFSDATSSAERATQIDPRNREIAAVVQRALAVSLARAKGDDLFKASKFTEACAAYGEGLDHEPQNSFLLFNRAVCLSKLRQWRKAVEDCTLALSLRPSYKKARMKRADCYLELERWEDAIQDYKILIQQMPEDEEVRRALGKVHNQLKDRDTEDDKANLHVNTVVVNTGDQLKIGEQR